jgi:hypothetical protein
VGHSNDWIYQYDAGVQVWMLALNWKMGAFLLEERTAVAKAQFLATL